MLLLLLLLATMMVTVWLVRVAIVMIGATLTRAGLGSMVGLLSAVGSAFLSAVLLGVIIIIIHIHKVTRVM